MRSMKLASSHMFVYYYPQVSDVPSKLRSVMHCTNIRGLSAVDRRPMNYPQGTMVLRHTAHQCIR